MTVRAYDVALRDLGHQSIVLGEQRCRPAQPERLLLRIAMVEVHLMWRIHETAVGARFRLEDTKKCTCPLLTTADPGDLLVAVLPVVPPVER